MISGDLPRVFLMINCNNLPLVQRLSSQLQGAFLEVGLGTRPHDAVPDLSGAGEPELPNEVVVGDGLTAHSPGPGQDVDHTGGDPGLH